MANAEKHFKGWYKLAVMQLKLAMAVVCLSAVPLSAQEVNQLTTEEQKQGYALLFNGRNLDGWDGDRQLWSVKDGVIVGCSDEHPFKVNTFLIHKEEQADF